MLSPGDWLLVITGALLVGLAKGGLVGVGNLTVIFFAMAFDAKASVGILLPILIAADLVAIVVYRQHVSWGHLRGIMPWMTLGIIAGFFLFDRLSSRAIELTIGWIVLLMTGLQMVRWLLRERGKRDFAEAMPHSLLYRAHLGVVGGFSSMVANAAGPVGQLYFISVGLPKMAFIGTGVWCFFIVNLIKLPFQIQLGIIQLHSLQTSFLLIPFAVAGALAAPRIVGLIPQRWFTFAVWFFIVLAGAKLIFF